MTGLRDTSSNEERSTCGAITRDNPGFCLIFGLQGESGSCIPAALGFIPESTIRSALAGPATLPGSLSPLISGSVKPLDTGFCVLFELFCSWPLLEKNFCVYMAGCCVAFSSLLLLSSPWLSVPERRDCCHGDGTEAGTVAGATL